MEREQRLKVLNRSKIEELLDEMIETEYDISIPSRLKIHCPKIYDVNVVAKEIVSLIEGAVQRIVEDVEESLPEGNELEGGTNFHYHINENDIIVDLWFCPFEEYGHDVDFHDEFFDIGDVISKLLKELSSEEGKYPGLTYEGIVSWKQYSAMAYVSYDFLCNMKHNEYAKEVILNDDEFWDEYECYFEDEDEDEDDVSDVE